MNSLIAFGLLCFLACVSAQYGNTQFAIDSAWFTSESCSGNPNAFQFFATGICLPGEEQGTAVGINTICNTGSPGYNTSVYYSTSCAGSPIAMKFAPGGCLAEGGVGTGHSCGKVPIYANWCHLAVYAAPGCNGPVIGGQAASVGFCVPVSTGGFISVWPNATTYTMTMKTCSDYLCSNCNSTILPLGCVPQSSEAVWCYGANGQLIAGSTTGVQTTTGAHTTTGAAHTTTGAAHTTTGHHTTTGAAHTTTGAPHTTTGAPHTTTGAPHTTTGAPHTTTGAAHTTTGGAHTTNTATSTTASKSTGVQVFAGFASVVLLLVALLF